MIFKMQRTPLSCAIQPGTLGVQASEGLGAGSGLPASEGVQGGTPLKGAGRRGPAFRRRGGDVRAAVLWACARRRDRWSRFAGSFVAQLRSLTVRPPRRPPGQPPGRRSASLVWRALAGHRWRASGRGRRDQAAAWSPLGSGMNKPMITPTTAAPAPAATAVAQ